jgi:hypothetical protein
VVLFDLLEEEEVDHVVELAHELGPRGDRIIFEIFLAVCEVSVAMQLLEEFLIVLCTSKPPGALVVHLAPGSHSVEGEDDGLGGFEEIDDSVDIVKDLDPYFLEFSGHELGLEDNGVVLPIVTALLARTCK